jgi:hypothetical protein
MALSPFITNFFEKYLGLNKFQVAKCLRFSELWLSGESWSEGEV